MNVKYASDLPLPGFARIRIAPVPVEAPLHPCEMRPAVLVDACDGEGKRHTYELDWCTDASLRLDPNAGDELRVRVIATGRDEIQGLPLAIELGADGREAIAGEVRRQLEAIRAEERRAHPLRRASAEDFPPADAAHFPALHRSLLDPDTVTLQLRPKPGDVARGATAAALRVIADELATPTDSGGGPPLGAPGSVARAAQQLGIAMRKAGHLVEVSDGVPRARRREAT